MDMGRYHREELKQSKAVSSGATVDDSNHHATSIFELIIPTAIDNAVPLWLPVYVCLGLQEREPKEKKTLRASCDETDGHRCWKK